MKKISGKELDKLFDDNKVDIMEYFDLTQAVRPNRVQLDEPKKVNLTLPMWLINRLDEEASHLAISRQAVVVTWLAEMASQKPSLHA